MSNRRQPTAPQEGTALSPAQDPSSDDSELIAGLQAVDYLAVLEASPNAIIAVDARGRIVYANPHVSLTFGWEPAELVGQLVEALLPERFATDHVAHRLDFAQHPSARPMGLGMDLLGRRRDGGEFPVEIALSPLETTAGPLIFATVVDISARKALEGQLLQAQKMESIGRLAGGIAHDFNNMLFAIRGYADLMVEDLTTKGEAASDLLSSVRAIQSAADRATTLTSQLLAFSRQRIPSSQVLDLNTVVADIEPLLRRLIGENIDFALHLDPEAGRFRGDPGQFDQILVNLVINARDALPMGNGTIAVETGQAMLDELYVLGHSNVTPGEYVVLSVSDTGVGMDEETRAHAFEPFFTTKGQGQGTGLGLSTIYGIVHQAGGQIWLYSEPGQGTTFKIYFPRVDAEAVSATKVAKPNLTGQGRVLVVEDESVVRDLTTLVLERSGYQVRAAAEAATALAILEQESQNFEALVSDVVMPGMSGSELAGRVLTQWPGLGVVLMSGYTAEILDVVALRARGAVFLGKPFSRSDLVVAVQQAITAGRARSESARND